MIILITFKLLALRRIIAKERTRENLDALHSLIYDDILGSIKKNVEVGNLTIADGIKLQNMTTLLYNHIYSGYEELEGENDMTDESIMFPIDILEKKYEEEIKLKDNAIAEKDNAIAEKDNAIAEKDITIAEKDITIADKDNAIAEKDNAIAEKDAEIERLKKQLEELKR